MTRFCQEHGNIHEVTASYMPKCNSEQNTNGYSKLHFLSSGAPKNLWEVLLFACFIRTRIPQRDSNVTPYKHWKWRTPNIQFFKVWVAWLRFQYRNRRKRKSTTRLVDAIFIEYALNSSIIRFLVVNFEISDISNNTIIEVRDVVYFENIFSLISRIPIDPSCTLCLWYSFF